MLRDIVGAWGEEIMAVESSAMRGFDRPRAARLACLAGTLGATVEWDECGMARIGNVALICIEGPLSRVGSWWGCQGYDQILEAHDKSFRSDALGVLQVHHSPGGYVSGNDECGQAIEAMARASGKPLHALSADMMYSASMRIGCAAQERYVTRAGGMGSIGVMVTRPDYTKMNTEMGIRIETIASGEYKSDGSPDVAITTAEIERIKGRIDFHSALFFSAASLATGLTVAEVQGQKAALYLGQQAVDARLAKSVDTLAGCVARLETMTSVRSMVSVPSGLRGQQQRQQQVKGISMEMGMLAIALGLSAEAKDQEIMVRVTGLTGTEARLKKETGQASADEAFATIGGLRENSGKLEAAHRELTELRAKDDAREYAALFASGEAKGKITPQNAADVRESHKTPAALTAFLKTALCGVPGAAGAGQTAADKGGSLARVDDAGSAALTYKGKAYKDLTFSARADWSKANPDEWKMAKVAFDKETA